ncbi:MAG: toxin-antitoxin system HicB family antitoxin [Cyanobacteria bacterium P01_C01_bin.69]
MTGLNVQLPNSLYDSLQELATQDGISIDQFIALAVAEKISALKTVGYLEELAKKGDRGSYDAVLAKVPNVEPDEWDRWPAES